MDGIATSLWRTGSRYADRLEGSRCQVVGGIPLRHRPWTREVNIIPPLLQSELAFRLDVAVVKGVRCFEKYGRASSRSGLSCPSFLAQRSWLRTHVRVQWLRQWTFYAFLRISALWNAEWKMIVSGKTHQPSLRPTNENYLVQKSDWASSKDICEAALVSFTNADGIQTKGKEDIWGAPIGLPFEQSFTQLNLHFITRRYQDCLRLLIHCHISFRQYSDLWKSRLQEVDVKALSALEC